MTGNELKRRIRALEMTQREFAGVTGWHPVSVTRLVRLGSARLPMRSARRMKESLALAKSVGKAG